MICERWSSASVFASGRATSKNASSDRRSEARRLERGRPPMSCRTRMPPTSNVSGRARTGSRALAAARKSRMRRLETRRFEGARSPRPPASPRGRGSAARPGEAPSESGNRTSRYPSSPLTPSSREWRLARRDSNPTKAARLSAAAFASRTGGQKILASGSGARMRLLFESPGAFDGDVLVYLGRVAADADGADDLPVEQDRNTALERRRVGESQSGHAAVADLILEDLARPPVDRRGASLADPDVDAGDLGSVHPFEQDDVSAVVHDHDDDLDLSGSRGFLSRGRHLASRGEAQDLLIERLGAQRRGGRGQKGRGQRTQSYGPAGDSHSEPLSLRARAQAQDPVVRGDVEHAAILAPVQVARLDAGLDAAQACAVGREHVDASGSGAEDVAVLVEFQAVRHALRILHPGARLGELPAAPERAVRPHRVGHPDRVLAVRIADVERLFVG